MIRETFALILLLSINLFKADDDDVCQNPENQTGSCINLSNCPKLLEILSGPRPIPPSKLNFLQQSQCGFDGSMPKVCCTNDQKEPTTTATTPNKINENTDESEPDPPDVLNHPNINVLNHTICGIIQETKVVGGNKTKVLAYPWMALIAYDIYGSKEFRCGGTIINGRYILTAAHCVTGLPSGLTLSGVRVGEHDLSTERDCDRDKRGMEIVCSEGYQDFLIESFKTHPNYLKSKLQDDIALIRLNNDINFQPKNVKPICLPIGTAQKIRSNKFVVTGWGATETGPNSQVLLYANINRVSNAECADTYKKSTEIWYKQMCAGGTDGKDSCLGDSGGPLQSTGLYFGNPRWIQYGIVSFGPKSCGIEGFPGVYTKLPYYVDWILNNIH